jgi:hypothetical protein
MKNQILQRKKRSVISYLSRKDLQVQFDWDSLKPASQLFVTKTDQERFKKLINDPSTCVAKAVRAGRKAHTALETGVAKDALNEAVLNAFETAFEKDLEEVWGLEEWLAHPLGIKGRFDGVGVFQGKLTIFDHKKTNKRKTRSQLKGYFDQLTAYRLSHNFLYPDHTIEQVAIFNIWGTDPTEIGAEPTVITGKELDELQLSFLERLETWTDQ